MSRFIDKQETARLRAAKPDSFQARLYDALRNRTYRNTRFPGFVQPGDTQEWWHLCWERASDAAFTWHMERDEALGQWIRGVAFWMRDIEDTEWIGPWYRSHERPLMGHLETAHVSLAMCEILDLCDGLFTAEETASLEAALREKGMEPCLRYCQKIQAGQGHINNWYNVLLMGYGVCALYFNDDAAVEKTLFLLRDSYSLYNADSYGESVQYSNYASLTLAHLNELLLRLRPDTANGVELDCYAHLIPWYAASFLYMKPWDGEEIWPRTLNFADSAAVFRPTGDVLAQVAVRLKARMPREAGLASWLFETTYADPGQGMDELATFGFYNQFRYHAVLMQPDMAPALTPGEATLCEKMQFENGQVILRDRWENTRGVLAVQAGYQPLNVTSHRHQDHGSFQFVQGRERMIVDGGHCCYRLNAYRYSCSTSQHATIDFVGETQEKNFGMPANPYDGVEPMYTADGNFYQRKPPRVRNLRNAFVGRAHVLSMDLTDAFNENVVLARRAFVSLLPHAIFIIDQAETAAPLRMRTHFPVNNRDGKLNTHRADEHRYVFRRGGEAMKVFECECFVDGEKLPSRMQFDWGYVHRNYHPLANTEGQGKEGSAEIYNWVDARPGRQHLRICAIAADAEPRIKGWHMKPDEQGDWYIESPEKEKLLRLRIRNNHAYLLEGEDEIEVL